MLWEVFNFAILSDGTWPEAQTFSMAFANDRLISIQTDRHIISPDWRRDTVKDRGSGNVLNGLQFNNRAYPMLGNTPVSFDLTGPNLT